jgi:ribonucleoside-diphosphate reductase alpha chain
MRVSKGQEDVTFSAKDQQAADERLADTTDGFEATSPAAVRSKKEAGKRPALPMNDKVDLASAELVEDTLGDTSLLAGMLAGVAAKAAAQGSRVRQERFQGGASAPLHHRHRCQARRAADRFRKETLDDRYLLPGETYQDLFARVADAYADDQDHAQRLYDYISRLWFMPATPVLSNGGTGRGLPISCYLNTVEDSLEGIVNTWNENVWLASRGGGIGTYWGKVRGIGESVGLNGKTSGIIPFVRVMDSLTLAISQGSLRRGSAACYLDVAPGDRGVPRNPQDLGRLQPQGAQPAPWRAADRRLHARRARWRGFQPQVAQGWQRARHRQRPRPVPEAGRGASRHR